MSADGHRNGYGYSYGQQSYAHERGHAQHTAATARGWAYTPGTTYTGPSSMPQASDGHWSSSSSPSHQQSPPQQQQLQQYNHYQPTYSQQQYSVGAAYQPHSGSVDSRDSVEQRWAKQQPGASGASYASQTYASSSGHSSSPHNLPGAFAASPPSSHDRHTGFERNASWSNSNRQYEGHAGRPSGSYKGLSNASPTSQSSLGYHGQPLQQPLLPILTAGTTGAGFSDLLGQQMDEIQAKHSPLASPITPVNGPLQRNDTLKQQYDDTPTPRGSYANAGIIAMYADSNSSPSSEGRTPPNPPPKPVSRSDSRSAFQQRQPYRPPPDPLQHDPRSAGSRPSTSAALVESSPVLPQPPFRTMQTSLPSWNSASDSDALPMSHDAYIPRPRTSSAATDASSSTVLSRPSVRTSPNVGSAAGARYSPAYSSSSHSSSARPSYESVASSSSSTASYGFPNSSSSTTLPRSSTSSSIGSKSTMSSHREARPLPVPQEAEENFQFYSPSELSPKEDYGVSPNGHPVHRSVSSPAPNSKAKASRTPDQPFPSQELNKRRPSDFSPTGRSAHRYQTITGAAGAPFIPQPPLHHSSSDPITVSAPTPHSTPVKQPVHSLANIAEAPSQLKTFRSASFSTSTSSTSYAAARAQASRHRETDPYQQVPPSPSISISHSFNDSSATSSAPSHSSHRLQKQNSLAPSTHSVSMNSLHSSTSTAVSHRRDFEKEKQRMERLGLRYLNPALLSNLSIATKDRLPRTVNVKSTIGRDPSRTR